MQASVEHLNRLLTSEGPQTSSQIQQRLGISQPTASRLIQRAGESIARIGRGRSSLYARIRSDFGNTRLPIYTINALGHHAQIASLIPLSGGGYLVEGEALQPYLLGHHGSGLFEDLPYFLQDSRPQGYLGRRLARQLSATYPENPEQWSSDHIIRYLIDHGSDLPGNLILGDVARARLNNTPITGISHRATHYPALAEQAIHGELPGSSAGGEQPKFTSYSEDRGHVIVKFSPAGSAPADVRWRDLLIAEYLAANTIANFGMPSAESLLHSFDSRIFLESRRFDREGQHGRKPMISLLMVHAEFVGSSGNWIDACEPLVKQKRLNHADFQQVLWLHHFGQWIGNSDMHLGNLSLTPSADGFTLLPAYDMLPMRYAPSAQGEIPERGYEVPLMRAGHHQVWKDSGVAAIEFWRQVEGESLISEDFKAIARKIGSDIQIAINVEAQG